MGLYNSLPDPGAQPKEDRATSSDGGETRGGVECRKASLAMVGLLEVANQRPFYRYNGMWTRQMENASFANIFLWWLGIRVEKSGIHLAPEGELLSYERVAANLNGIQSNTCI